MGREQTGVIVRVWVQTRAAQSRPAAGQHSLPRGGPVARVSE